MTNFWRGLAQDIVETQYLASPLNATEALAPKSLEAVDGLVDVAIYTHVYNVHGDYLDSIEGGEGLRASEIHFLPFSQPRDILGVDMRVLVGLLHKQSFQRFMADRGLEALVSDSLLYDYWIDSIDRDFSDYLLSLGVDLSAEEMAAVNQLEIQDYHTLIDFYNGARIRNGKGASLAAQIRTCSAFYIGRETMQGLYEVQGRYVGMSKNDEREYGGVVYVSASGELLLEECKTCQPDFTELPSGNRVFSLRGVSLSEKYPNSSVNRKHVASWHTHPPSAKPEPWVPSEGDVDGFMVLSNYVKNGGTFHDGAELPRLISVNEKFIRKTYRVSGAFGLLLSEDHLTIYRHTGPVLKRLGAELYLHYQSTKYADLYHVVQSVGNIPYIAYRKKTLAIEYTS